MKIARISWKIVDKLGNNLIPFGLAVPENFAFIYNFVTVLTFIVFIMRYVLSLCLLLILFRSHSTRHDFHFVPLKA